jgi:hypothetical protein
MPHETAFAGGPFHWPSLTAIDIVAMDIPFA